MTNGIAIILCVLCVAIACIMNSITLYKLHKRINKLGCNILGLENRIGRNEDTLIKSCRKHEKANIDIRILQEDVKKLQGDMHKEIWRNRVNMVNIE